MPAGLRCCCVHEQLVIVGAGLPPLLALGQRELVGVGLLLYAEHQAHLLGGLSGLDLRLGDGFTGRGGGGGLDVAAHLGAVLRDPPGDRDAAGEDVLERFVDPVRFLDCVHAHSFSLVG